MNSIELLNLLIKSNEELINHIESKYNKFPSWNDGALSVLKAREKTYKDLLIKELTNKVEQNKK